MCTPLTHLGLCLNECYHCMCARFYMLCTVCCGCVYVLPSPAFNDPLSLLVIWPHTNTHMVEDHVSSDIKLLYDLRGYICALGAGSQQYHMMSRERIQAQLRASESKSLISVCVHILLINNPQCPDMFLHVSSCFLISILLAIHA